MSIPILSDTMSIGSDTNASIGIDPPLNKSAAIVECQTDVNGDFVAKLQEEIIFKDYINRKGRVQCSSA